MNDSTVAFICVLLLSGTIVVASATPIVSQNSQSEETTSTHIGRPFLTLNILREDDQDGTVQFQFQFRTSAKTKSVQVHFGSETQVTSVMRFERTASGTYVLTDTTASPSITATTNVLLQDAVADTSPNDTATEEWAFALIPHIHMRWRTSTSTWSRWVYPLRQEMRNRTTVTMAEKGTWGGHYLFLGNYTSYSRHQAGQTIRLIVPNAAQLTETPEAILTAVGNTSTELSVGSRDKVVTMFAVSSPFWLRGEASFRFGEVLVQDTSRLETVNTPWIHEYVHTRQSFDTGPRMSWFTEASASYFTLRYGRDKEYISRQELEAYFECQPSDSVLANQSTWQDDSVPYHKGAKVLTTLNQRIQNATDGQKSLEDVMRRINSHPNTITYPEFKQIVSSVSGESMDRWLDTWVTGSKCIDN